MVGAVRRVSKAGSIEDGTGWFLWCHPVDAINIATVVRRVATLMQSIRSC
jgi:hypothetical protein